MNQENGGWLGGEGGFKRRLLNHVEEWQKNNTNQNCLKFFSVLTHYVCLVSVCQYCSTAIVERYPVIWTLELLSLF